MGERAKRSDKRQAPRSVPWPPSRLGLLGINHISPCLPCQQGTQEHEGVLVDAQISFWY